MRMGPTYHNIIQCVLLSVLFLQQSHHLHLKKKRIFANRNDDSDKTNYNFLKDTHVTLNCISDHCTVKAYKHHTLSAVVNYEGSGILS